MKELPAEAKATDMKPGGKSYRVHNESKTACIEAHMLLRKVWLIKGKGQPITSNRNVSRGSDAQTAWTKAKNLAHF